MQAETGNNHLQDSLLPSAPDKEDSAPPYLHINSHHDRWPKEVKNKDKMYPAARG